MAAGAAGFGFTGGPMPPIVEETTELTVPLSGLQVPEGGLLTGSGSVKLVFSADEVCYKLTTTSGVMGNRMHIHNAGVGMSGGVSLTLFDALAMPPVPAAMSGCVAAEEATILAILGAPAEFYINVHSVAFPGGTIRGQLGVATTELVVSLSGLQVPEGGLLAGSGSVTMIFSADKVGVATTELVVLLSGTGLPSGSGFVTMIFSADKVCYTLSTTADVMGNRMHIHNGGVGMSGGVTLTLFDALGAPPVAVDESACVATTSSTVLAILAVESQYYVNVHSVAHPGGAIRGQLGVETAELVVPLSGSGLVPGSGSVTMAISANVVCYKLTTTANVMANRMHIHEAPFGMSGDVTVTLFDALAAPPVPVAEVGCVGTTEAKTMAILATPADYYVNVHSAAFPGGAIRGQIA
ncbi:hypothetical protein M885DRAFT_503031 [Pelagophyceae sp. CCMP2097]|nr:hypothetical protein M885DRAFT_503031 [Pelagophyceae sp. CCMP2097]